MTPPRIPDHPTRRAADSSKLASWADRWRVIAPVVIPTWIILATVYAVAQRQMLLPDEVEKLAARVTALERADTGLAARSAAIEGKLNAALIQQSAILRAVCLQLTARERELAACPAPGSYLPGNYRPSAWRLVWPPAPAAPALPDPPPSRYALPERRVTFARALYVPDPHPEF